MANTTNYNWETPDDTDLVKDGAAAIRTLGSSIDTTTKALNPSTTLGDIEYRSATANTNTRLAIGSTGQVLTVSGGVPTWANATGGGKVLQVINFTSTASGGTSTNTFVDSSLTATITPSSTSSKILVTAFINVQKDSGANSYGGQQLVRGSTVIASMGTQDGYTGNSDANNIGNTGITYLDSPSSTSALTYKVQINSFGNNGSIAYGSGGARSSITLMEIGA